MVTAPDLRVCYHGFGPVRATAWWIWADGSTSEHVDAVCATRELAVAAVREGASLIPHPRLHAAPRSRHTF